MQLWVKEKTARYMCEILYVLFTVVHLVPRINSWHAEGAKQIIVK